MILQPSYLHNGIPYTARWHNYTPHTTNLLGEYTGFTPSVRPSVCPSVSPSVRPAPRVRSVVPTVLVGSISYLYMLSSNFRNRPEVRKLLLFYFYFFFTWSWKIIPYLFFTFSWPEVGKLFHIYFLLFLDLKLENYSIFTFLLFLDLKLENYSIFRWWQQLSEYYAVQFVLTTAWMKTRSSSRFRRERVRTRSRHGPDW